MTLPKLDPAVDALIGEAAEALRDVQSLSIACHVWPDGDAIGSLAGVTLALTRQGRTISASWGDDDPVVPAQYEFIPGTDLLGTELAGNRVALSLDCATAERLGKVRGVLESAEVLVNLDHHISNTRFGTLNCIDPDAPSTSELATHLLDRLGAPIDADVATCLYVGLVTDTGRFAYPSATPRAFAVAGFLVGKGVAVDRINQLVYETVPFGYQKCLGRVLERCVLESDPEVVRSYLTQQDLSDTGLSMDDTDDFIDHIRRVDTDVALLLKQTREGWKGSLRSRGATDVGGVAQALGGGGHKLAAGFTIPVESHDDALARVLNELR